MSDSASSSSAAASSDELAQLRSLVSELMRQVAALTLASAAPAPVPAPVQYIVADTVAMPARFSGVTDPDYPFGSFLSPVSWILLHVSGLTRPKLLVTLKVKGF